MGQLSASMDEIVIQPMICHDVKTGQILGGRLLQPHGDLNTVDDVLNVLQSLGPLDDQPKSVVVVAASAVGDHLDLCPIVMQASPRKGEGTADFWELIENLIRVWRASGVRRKIMSLSMDGDTRMRLNIHNLMRIDKLISTLQYVYLHHPDSRYAAPIFQNYGPLCFNPDPEHMLKNYRNAALNRFMIMGPHCVAFHILEKVRKRVQGPSDKGTRHNLGRNDLNHLVSSVCWVILCCYCRLWVCANL